MARGEEYDGYMSMGEKEGKETGSKQARERDRMIARPMPAALRHEVGGIGVISGGNVHGDW